jgi:hypothetical protein
MRGWGHLQSAADLARNVQRDLKRLQALPGSTDVAYDFFVTAFHVIDWVYPTSKTERKHLQAEEPLLDIAGHLCNGAKHFEAKQWNQVDRMSQRGRYFPPGYFNPNLFAVGYFRSPGLTITLTAAEATRFGATELEALVVAKKICEFWEAHFGLPPLP